jgi:hypothetical protein
VFSLFSLYLLVFQSSRFLEALDPVLSVRCKFTIKDKMEKRKVEGRQNGRQERTGVGREDQREQETEEGRNEE